MGSNDYSLKKLGIKGKKKNRVEEFCLKLLKGGDWSHQVLGYGESMELRTVEK